MMVRIFNVYFPVRALLVCLGETILVALSFLVVTRVYLGPDAELFLAYEGGAAKILLVTVVFIVCIYYLDLYDTLVLTNRREILVRLLAAIGIGTVIFALLYTAYPGAQIDLHQFVGGICLMLVLIGIWRELVVRGLSSHHLVERALLLGEGPLAIDLAEQFVKRPEIGIRLMGYVSDYPGRMNGLPLEYLGRCDRLISAVKKSGASRLVVAVEERRGSLPVEGLLSLKTDHSVRVQDGVDVYETLTGKLPVQSLRLSWLLFSPGFRVSRSLLFHKRLLSVIVSGFLLVLFSPIMLLIALIIRLDSPGPVIFRQPRVGQHGKIFLLYKFRSMFHGSEAHGNHPPLDGGDGRLTRVGRILRRTRLDELPQLCNILRGDMHFVGPRPFVPEQEQELVQKVPLYAQRWVVKPGITGWAQVKRGYCVTVEDNEEKLAYDLFYIKNMSVRLDLLIIFVTVKILLLGRGGR
jgi:exopolysaccharide biosynthesis polyprenyl glycosylphosphotransferase